MKRCPILIFYFISLLSLPLIIAIGGLRFNSLSQNSPVLFDHFSSIGDDDPEPVLTVLEPQKISLVKILSNVLVRAFDMSANSTLHLKCTGSRELRWSFPQNQLLEEESIANLANISESCRLTGEPSLTSSLGARLCVSDFVLSNTSFEQTGLFSCHYNQSQVRNFSPLARVLPSASELASSETPNPQSSIYVFINDHEFLFVPYRGQPFQMVLIVVQYQPFTIPCRPNASGVNITLFKQGPNGEEVMQIGPDSGSYYSPLEGFHFRRLRWGPEPSTVRCVANYGPRSDQYGVSIQWLIDPGPLHPIIDASEAEFVTLDSSFTLVCSVRAEVGANIATVTWKHPVADAGRVWERDVSGVRGNAVAAAGDGKSLYDVRSRTLTVYGTRKSDEGVYSCIVVSATGRSFLTHHFVEVHSTTYQPFVNLSTDFYRTEETALKRRVGEEVQFVVNVVAFPNISSISLSWDKDGHVIDDDPHYQTLVEGSQAVLAIREVTMKDTGVYTLIGTTTDELSTSSVSMIMHVMGKPLIEIDKGMKYYLVNRNYTLSCHVYAYPPAAKIGWLWLPCPSPDTCFTKSNDWLAVSETTTNSNRETVISGNEVQLNVTARESGIYSCYGLADKSTTTENELFVVTDAMEGFQIIPSTDQPVENETISLSCRASPFRFNNLLSLEWQFVPLTGRESIRVSNSSEISVWNGTSKYSSWSEIQIHRAAFSHSGTYTCLSHEKDSESLSALKIDLEIEKPEAPVITFTNLNESRVEQSATTEMVFTCKASGKPKPTVTWLKNGVALNESASNGIEVTDDGQRLEITRLAPSDSGFYECIVSNVRNSTRRSQALKVVSEQDSAQLGSVVLIVVFVMIGIVFGLMAVWLGRKIREDRRQKQDLAFFAANLFDEGQVDLFNPEIPLNDQVELLSYDRRWEFPRERLKLGKTLGQGAFGRVVKAEAIGLDEGKEWTTVAVKMLKERVDAEQQRALIAELKILIHLGRHVNIVNLLAACTSGLIRGELLVVVEYCAFGNLRQYLLDHRGTFVDQIDPLTGNVDSTILARHTGSSDRQENQGYININSNGQPIGAYGWNQDSQSKIMPHAIMTQNTSSGKESEMEVHIVDPYVKYAPRPSVPREEMEVTTSDLICFAFQVARGMEYLSARRLIHRDLAARNVLLADDKVVKICDFGLAKDCAYEEYVKKGDGLLPVKWMAVESIRDKVYNTKTDVWSFGVLCWEFFSLGGNPYPGMEVDEAFYKKLEAGYRMHQPNYCPDFFWKQIVVTCWHADPNLRPNFSQLCDQLGHHLEKSIVQHYVDLNDSYQEMNKILAGGGDYVTMRRSSSLSTKRDYVIMDRVSGDYSSSRPTSSSPSLPLN